MVKMTKFFILCVGLICHSTSAIVNSGCVYDLCKTRIQQQGNDYLAAEGSAISSQFQLPDGSVVTNSKETIISSDGVKKTFHQLKKDADRFVKGESEGLYTGLPSIIPNIHPPPISVLPVGHLPHVSFPFSPPVVSSSVQGSSQQQGNYIQQSGSLIQQEIQASPAITSSSHYKETESKKTVVSTSKGVPQYPAGSGQYQYIQQNVIDNSHQGISGIPVTYQISGSANYVPSEVPYGGRKSSTYESAYSRSQNSSESHGQSGYLPQNSFTVGTIDLNHGSIGSEQPDDGLRSITSTSYTTGKVSHGRNENLYGEIRTVARPSHTEVQYESNAATHTHKTENSEVPNDHIGQFVTRVNQPAAVSSSHSYNTNEHSSSQISGSFPQINGGQFSSSKVIYESQPVLIPTDAEITKSENTKFSSSAQSHGFQSPIILHGEPQNIPLGQHTTSISNSGSHIYVDGVQTIPLVPQSSVKSSSSSSSSKRYQSISSSGSIPSNGYYYGGDQKNEIKGASSSIYNQGHANSNAEVLCDPCSTHISSSAVPHQNTFGFSSSYSSHSTNINGKKTESREAAVAVNDNGKYDSYHVKS